MEKNHEELLAKLEHYQARLMPENIFFSYPVHAPARGELSFRIVVVLSGEAALVTGDISGKAQRQILTAGSVLIGFPGSPSNVAERSTCTTFVTCFFPRYIRIAEHRFQASFVPESDFCNYLMHPPAEIFALCSFIQQFHNSMMNLDALSHYVQMIWAITCACLQKTKPASNMGKANATWIRIASYCAENVAGDLSRAGLCTKFRMNGSYLSTLCRRNSGKTLTEFVNELRLLKSVSLLQLDLSLDEIAEQCGFCNTGYFIRLFKKRFEQSPGKYRKSLQTNKL